MGAWSGAGGWYQLAVYSWVAHRLMGAGISRAAAMGSVFGAGGLLFLPVLILTGAPLLASPQAFWVASYMALIPMFAGYLLFSCGLTRVSPSTATTITLVEPAVATLLAVAIVGEELSAEGWAGMVLLGAALALLALPQRLLQWRLHPVPSLEFCPLELCRLATGFLQYTSDLLFGR